MKKLRVLFLVLGAFYSLNNAYADKLPGLKTVDYVDLKKCEGKWYEIAKYPNFIQGKLICGTATWSMKEDKDINVYFEGKKCDVKGKCVKSKLKGWIVDKNTNARFRILFFWPFSGEYDIIDLGKDYEYAVVSKPSRKHLWILCRSPRMDEETYRDILRRLETQGFDLTKLTKTPQNGE
ncbi:MAG: hypothetical protein A3J83_05225 [Elusimicrobia bacterium RIFOXYA2_FULL_40_6]|nr:MAG: hypothetical protein A3J83_05225 [Elusimicrobia bacterium RIFOXYA2_FULL_40_6]